MNHPEDEHRSRIEEESRIRALRYNSKEVLEKHMIRRKKSEYLTEWPPRLDYILLSHGIEPSNDLIFDIDEWLSWTADYRKRHPST